MIPLGSLVRWVGLLSHHTSEPLQSPFTIGPRPPLQGRSRYACFVCFLCTPECDYCIHTCPNEPHQEGQRILVRFNRTIWGRCYPLSTSRNQVLVQSHCFCRFIVGSTGEPFKNRLLFHRYPLFHQQEPGASSEPVLFPVLRWFDWRAL